MLTRRQLPEIAAHRRRRRLAFGGTFLLASGFMVVKAIEYNATMSRAFQMRGQALMKLDQNDEAGEVLTQGYTIAAERGDVMPQKSIAAMLEKLGLPIPETEDFEAKKREVEASGDMILDKRTGQPQAKLPDPPMRGPVGAYIYANFGQDTWREWIGQGTKVINELRLDLSRDEDAAQYDRHMHEYLGIDEALLEKLHGEAASK